jgi:hypothetical protein
MGDRGVEEAPPTGDAAEEAREVLRLLRKCRSRLNKLNLHHAAAYTDIAVQLLKQAMAQPEEEADEAPSAGPRAR